MEIQKLNRVMTYDDFTATNFSGDIRKPFWFDGANTDTNKPNPNVALPLTGQVAGHIDTGTYAPRYAPGTSGATTDPPPYPDYSGNTLADTEGIVVFGDRSVPDGTKSIHSYCGSFIFNWHDGTPDQVNFWRRLGFTESDVPSTPKNYEDVTSAHKSEFPQGLDSGSTMIYVQVAMSDVHQAQQSSACGVDLIGNEFYGQNYEMHLGKNSVTGDVSENILPAVPNASIMNPEIDNNVQWKAMRLISPELWFRGYEKLVNPAVPFLPLKILHGTALDLLDGNVNDLKVFCKTTKYMVKKRTVDGYTLHVFINQLRDNHPEEYTCFLQNDTDIYSFARSGGSEGFGYFSQFLDLMCYAPVDNKSYDVMIHNEDYMYGSFGDIAYASRPPYLSTKIDISADDYGVGTKTNAIPQAFLMDSWATRTALLFTQLEGDYWCGVAFSGSGLLKNRKAFGNSVRHFIAGAQLKGVRASGIPDLLSYSSYDILCTNLPTTTVGNKSYNSDGKQYPLLSKLSKTYSNESFYISPDPSMVMTLTKMHVLSRIDLLFQNPDGTTAWELTDSLGVRLKFTVPAHPMPPLMQTMQQQYQQEDQQLDQLAQLADQGKMPSNPFLQQQNT